jgi:hypothetical protein
MARARKAASKKQKPPASKVKVPKIKKASTKKKASASKKAPTKKASAKNASAKDLWALIEKAWSEVAPELAAARAAPTEENVEALDEALEDVIAALRSGLDALDKDSLLAVDRTLERALYDIDRQEVQEATDGSDDGFLYARGFIVALGKTFFDAVNATPSRALMDAECEAMCYLPWHLYKEKFGDPPSSGISRESCSNAEGW